MNRMRSSFPIVSAFLAGCVSFAVAAEKRFDDYPEHVLRYLARLYREDAQSLAFRPEYPGGFDRWQAEARADLVRRIGLERISASAGGHRPSVELGDAEARDGYTLRRGVIETEPDVRIPFWLLQPKGEGPWPLGVFPHGHSTYGHDTSAGVYADAAREKKALEEDRDVAVQAVRRGFLAIAPAVRGISVDGVPDLHGRHGKLACRSHVMHCLVAGRTATGERVWDMQRIIDWAHTLPGVDRRQTLMMGNSGGGMVTIFSAACDPRITIAVPSCSFAPTVSAGGYLFHCDCNMVPGLLELGGLAGVAGLIAPRRLLTVNGAADPMFSREAIERASAEVLAIFEAAGAAGCYEHRWGDGGHRFYKDLMWPFIDAALAAGAAGPVR